MCHSTEIFRVGTLLCSRKFRVSKHFIDKKWAGGTIFWWLIFSLTVSKLLEEEPVCFPRSFWYRKLLRKERGRMSRFFVHFFPVSQEKKMFYRGTLLSSKNFLVTKTIRNKREGECHDFSVETFWSHCTITFRRATFLCFRNFLVSKNFRVMTEGRLSQFSVETSVSHRADVIPKGIFLCFTFFLLSKKINNKRGGGYNIFP